MKQLAQGLIINPGGEQVVVHGPLDNIDSIGDFMNIVVNSILYPLAGVVLFFIIIWGGYDLLMSQGDSDKVQAGKNKITAGVIGFILLVLSYFFAKFIGYVFNVGGDLF